MSWLVMYSKALQRYIRSANLLRLYLLEFWRFLWNWMWIQRTEAEDITLMFGSMQFLLFPLPSSDLPSLILLDPILLIGEYLWVLLHKPSEKRWTYTCPNQVSAVSTSMRHNDPSQFMYLPVVYKLGCCWKIIQRERVTKWDNATFS